MPSTTFCEKGQAGVFFSKSKSKLHGIIASISPNKGANKSTLQKKKKKKKKKISIYTSLKPVGLLRCKQVENNNLKIFLKDQNSQRKNNNFFFGILKIRGGILLYS